MFILMNDKSYLRDMAIEIGITNNTLQKYIEVEDSFLNTLSEYEKNNFIYGIKGCLKLIHFNRFKIVNKIPDFNTLYKGLTDGKVEIHYVIDNDLIDKVSYKYFSISRDAFKKQMHLYKKFKKIDI